jgi:hypothetical protein
VRLANSTIQSMYHMAWADKRPARLTYNSLSGHGLMIGSRTKRVICSQNYLKKCRKCEIHGRQSAHNKIPADAPVSKHHCPRNHKGSSKGMEAKAVLECIEKFWLHEEISAFIKVVCIDNDATTKAYLCHCFFDLDAKGLPRPTNLKGEPRSSTRDDKGKLFRDHPSLTFLANLCHQIRSFVKYLYALKPLSKKKSEMNNVD